MIDILLVDDQTLLRAGLKAILESTDDLRVVAEAGTGREALVQARKRKPSVILMDLQMPVMDGTAAVKAIRADALLANVPILVLTTFDDEDDVLAALAAGANGYLLKDIEADAPPRALRDAAAGEAQMSPRVLQGIIDRLARGPTRQAKRQQLSGLTEREIEILTHVGLGMSNEEIGRALFLSPETARTYVSRLLSKLHARDRSQLVVLAHRAGLVD